MNHGSAKWTVATSIALLFNKKKNIKIDCWLATCYSIHRKKHHNDLLTLTQKPMMIMTIKFFKMKPTNQKVPIKTTKCFVYLLRVQRNNQHRLLHKSLRYHSFCYFSFKFFYYGLQQTLRHFATHTLTGTQMAHKANSSSVKWLDSTQTILIYISEWMWTKKKYVKVYI